MGVLHILLEILKWLGIIFGGVVGLIILLILLILFVPIRYKIEGSKYESTDAHVKVSWLLYSVRFLVDWAGGSNLSMKLKLLFFTLWKSDAKEKEEEFEPSTDEEKADLADLEAEAKGESPETAEIEFEEVELPSNINMLDVIAPEGAAEECEVIDLFADEEEEKPLVSLSKEEKKALKKAEKARRKAEREERKAKKAAEKAEDTRSLDEKIEALVEKVAGILHKPVELYEKFSRKKAVIEKYLTSERDKRAMLLIKDILIKTLKAIAPKKGKGKITLGTGDPGSTGQAMAGLSILYAGLRGKLQVTPNFEEKEFTGDGFIKGRIFVITLVVLFCKLWFNKDFKTFKKNTSELKDRVANA